MSDETKTEETSSASVSAEPAHAQSAPPPPEPTPPPADQLTEEERLNMQVLTAKLEKAQLVVALAQKDVELATQEQRFAAMRLIDKYKLTGKDMMDIGTGKITRAGDSTTQIGQAPGPRLIQGNGVPNGHGQGYFG